MKRDVRTGKWSLDKLIKAQVDLYDKVNHRRTCSIQEPKTFKLDSALL